MAGSEIVRAMSIVGGTRSDGRPAKVAEGMAKVAEGMAKVAEGMAKVARRSARVARPLASAAGRSPRSARRSSALAGPLATFADRLATFATPRSAFADRLGPFAEPRCAAHPRVVSSGESQAHTMSPPARLLLHTTLFQLALAALLFGAAGTLAFWQAWAYLGIYFVTSAVTNVYLIRVDPALLLRRLKRGDAGETEPLHRVFQALVGPLFLGLLAVAALDHRFGWSAVPPALAVVGLGLSFASYALIFFVFRENTFASSVIEVDARQTVVATGPYRVVRHPMYTGAVLGALATPIALGSTWAELFFVPVVAIIVLRLRGEERFLRERLRGYVEYTGKTRYRLVPGAW